MKQIVKNEKQLFVGLSSQIDDFRFAQFSSSQQHLELGRPSGLAYYPVKNLKEADQLCRKFIQFYDIGGSNWLGGKIIDADNNFIASVSYNGRVWESEDWPSKEIEI